MFNPAWPGIHTNGGNDGRPEHAAVRVPPRPDHHDHGNDPWHALDLGGFALKIVEVNAKSKKDLKKANVKIIRFHDLRHTCATLLLLANVNPKIVSERLGHSSVQITLDTYSHVIPGLQDKAAHEMDKMFGSEQAENPDPEKDDNDSLDEWDDVETI